MSTTMNHAVEKEYLALVRAFPLLSIRDEQHLEKALEVIDRLTDQPHRSAAEDAYLDALTDLVETYENAHVEIPSVSPGDALRYLMEENGLTAEDLASSPEIAAQILRHWLLVFDRPANDSTRNDPLISASHFAVQPNAPTERQAWAHYLAALLDVPPDAHGAFVETVVKAVAAHETRPTNGA